MPGQPPESTPPGQREQLGAHQVQRGVEVAVDEGGQLEAVQLGEIGEIPVQGGGLGRSAQGSDLRREGVGVGVHVEVRAVGELRAVGRLQRHEPQPVLELLADGASVSATISGAVKTEGPVSSP